MASQTNNSDSTHIYQSSGVVIDLSLLYSISDDVHFIRNIIQTFLETFPPTIARIETAISNNNLEEVYKAAHFAKSSLSIIKIGEMHPQAAQIEANAKRMVQVNAIPGLLDQIKMQFETASLFLKEKII